MHPFLAPWFGKGAKSCQELTTSLTLSLFAPNAQILWLPLFPGRQSKLSGSCLLWAANTAVLTPVTNKNNPQRGGEGPAHVLGMMEGEEEDGG